MTGSGVESKWGELSLREKISRMVILTRGQKEEVLKLLDEEAKKLKALLNTQHHLHDPGAFYRNKLKEVLEALEG